VKKQLLKLLISILVFSATNLFATESSPQFRKDTDTLLVYSDVPGHNSSNKYTIRVRSAATNNQWVDVFAHYTYNRAQELGGVSVPQNDGKILQTTVYHYAKHTSEWSHTYGNIEMSNNTAVEVEIAAKNGFEIGGKDFVKATVHPAQKASLAKLVDGKIYFTIFNPCQIVIDINGQMDDYNAAINPIGHPVHAISLFANPVIKKPSLNGAGVHYVEPGTDSAALRQINPASYDTLYFKPGVHYAGRDFKVYPGKVTYIPGDAIFYGNINNIGVPQGIYTKNGENITIYGYGTISCAKITHPNYVPDATGSFKGFEIENGLNWRVHGISIVDPANHSVYTIGGTNGLFSWTKVISWRANGDGIGGYEPAEDCFIRTQDDCSYAKGTKKRCTFWKDANAALFHMATISENMAEPLIIEDCDVIYARLRSPGATNGGGFQQRGGGTPGQRNVNVIFRDIRIHDKLVNMPIFHLVSYLGTSSSPTQVGSSYSGILFQNISIAGMAIGSKQRILGCSAAPWYGGLIFDNITIGGTRVTSENYNTYFETNEFVKYLLFGMPKDVALTLFADSIKGSVSRDPEQNTYSETSTVLLTAIAKPGYVFSHWSGDATGSTNPISVVVDKDMSVTASFSEPNFNLPIVIEAPGSGSFTIPYGIDSVTINVWGGGGAGGSASNGSAALQSRGGGGAGGSYAGAKKKVTSGQVLSFTLGAGGKPALSEFENLSVDRIQNGGSSKVSLDNQVIALALGGSGGQNIAGSFAGGAGGIAALTGNIGDVVFYGGKGGSGNSNGTGGGGGSAGAMGNGGNAGAPSAGAAGADGGAGGGIGINATNVGNPGQAPGAGGSGAAVRASANTSMKGGDGSNGKIIFIFKWLAAPLSYEIKAAANPAEGGTVSGSGTYQSGQSVSLSAKALPGYTFVNWTENVTTQSTDSSYSFMVNAPRLITANFSMIPTHASYRIKTVEPVKIYPNPVSGILHIDFGNIPSKREILIYNSSNQLVYRSRVINEKQRIDLKILSLKGLVIVQVIEDDQTSVHKVFVL